MFDALNWTHTHTRRAFNWPLTSNEWNITFLSGKISWFASNGFLHLIKNSSNCITLRRFCAIDFSCAANFIVLWFKILLQIKLWIFWRVAGAVNLIVVHMQDFTEIQTRIENVHIGIAAFKNIVTLKFLADIRNSKRKNSHQMPYKSNFLLSNYVFHIRFL